MYVYIYICLCVCVCFFVQVEYKTNAFVHKYDYELHPDLIGGILSCKILDG